MNIRWKKAFSKKKKRLKEWRAYNGEHHPPTLCGYCCCPDYFCWQKRRLTWTEHVSFFPLHSFQKLVSASPSSNDRYYFRRSQKLDGLWLLVLIHHQDKLVLFVVWPNEWLRYLVVSSQSWKNDLWLSRLCPFSQQVNKSLSPYY